jgi:hypothetical protein
MYRLGAMLRPLNRWQIAVALAFVVVACSTDQGPTSGPTQDEPGVLNGTVVGCGSIDQAACMLVAGRVLERVPAQRGRPFAVEVMLWGCPDGGLGCPKNLAARDGRVVVEYTDGDEPFEFTLKGPPNDPQLLPVAQGFWSGLINAKAERVAGPGPFPLELGHCGLSWQVDFDGSFWLPIGPYDADASAFINADSGLMRLLGPNRARFSGSDGFDVQLARFPGPKHVYLCA